MKTHVTKYPVVGWHRHLVAVSRSDKKPFFRVRLIDRFRTSATRSSQLQNLGRSFSCLRHTPAGADVPPCVSPRTGITLFEVVISLAILLVSLAALGQLFTTGSRAAIQSRLLSESTLRCQGKLSEVLGGIVPMTTVSNGSFEDGGSEWVWSLDVTEGPHADLFALEVTVSHLDESGKPDVTSSLRRYTRDPQLFVDAAALEAEFEQAQASQGGGTTP